MVLAVTACSDSSGAPSTFLTSASVMPGLIFASFAANCARVGVAA